MRYVENNPVRAGLVQDPEEYPWSSAKGHIQKGGDIILTEKTYLHNDIKNWSQYLKSDTDSSVVENIRAKTKVGRPYGEDVFMTKLDKKLGIELTKPKPGRSGKVRSPQSKNK